MLGFVANDNEDFQNNNQIIPEKTSNKKFTVAVEGNIGCGKSTFLQYFRNSKNVEVLSEPVQKWKDVNGHNTLQLMYEDAHRWSLTFQSYVQLTMLQQHSYQHTRPVKMMERSIFSAMYCFVENLHQSNMMPPVDYAILSEWFQWITGNTNVHLDLIVYLRASPITCLHRIQKRQRAEESSVPMEYLQTLQELHDNWLIDHVKYQPIAPVLIIDANKDIDELTLEFERLRTDILCGYS